MHVIRTGPFVVELNERLGGEITRIRYRDRDLLASYDWPSPVGVSQSSTYGDAKLDWLSDYRGGWQLLVPNAGAACDVDGVPLPFHGEWSRTHVSVTERAADRVVMTVLVTEHSGVGGIHPGVYRYLGVEPSEYKMIVMKTASNFQYMKDITTTFVRVATPGPTQSDVSSLPWSRIPRPMFPLDPLETWRT